MKSSVENIKNNERGAVLLTTLLIMAIMAALTVAVMDDIRLALKRTVNVSDYAQADWYVRGAEDYVGDVLANQFSSIDEANRNQALETISPLILPIENGTMILDIRDGSHCFNLGSLTTNDGDADTIASEQLLNLFEIIGVPLNISESLRARILDWIDADTQPRSGGAEDGSYLRRTPRLLPANAPLSSVMELRAIEGIEEDIYALLRPWLCIGEAHAPNQFNIDAAKIWHAPLLASFLGGEDKLPLAQRLILERPTSGYGNLNTLNENTLIKDLDDSEKDFTASDFWNNQLTFAPGSLWVELDLAYRKAQRSRSFYFTRLEDPLLVYRGWGRESFRPSLNIEALSEGERAAINRGEETR
jgi:general secretion pathway protein K